MAVPFFLALFLAQAFPAPTAQVLEPNAVESIVFRGNRSVRTDTILSYIRTKRGNPLNLETIARDVRTLYALGAFDDVHVATETGARGGNVVIFYFSEKPIIRSIDFQGLSSISKEDVVTELRRRKIRLNVDAPYDVAEGRRAEAVVTRMLADKGKSGAIIEHEARPFGTGDPPPAVALTFAVEEGAAVHIGSIDVEGNAAFSDREIKNAMKLVQETGPLSLFTHKDIYSKLKLQDDLTRIHEFLGDHGYARAAVLEPKIELKPVTVQRTLPFIKPAFPWGIPVPFLARVVNRYSVTIAIEEKDQYKVGEIQVKGARLFTEEHIKSTLNIKPGDVSSSSAVREGVENLRKEYGNRGYVNFSPRLEREIDDAAKVVKLTIDIDEGDEYVVHRITFSGNATTRDKVIRREFALAEGDIFNLRDLERSLFRVNRLGFFELVRESDADLKFNARDKDVDVNVRLREHGKNTIAVNGGVSGIGGGFVGLTYQTNNFLGRGNAVTLELQGGSQESTFVLSYNEPYLLDRHLQLGVSVYGRSYRYDQAREVSGIVPGGLPADLGFDNNRLDYQQSRRGLTVSGGAPFSGNQKLGLQYQFENSRTRTVNPATEVYFLGVAQSRSEGLAAVSPADFGVFQSRKLTPSYSWSTAIPAINPVQGHALNLSLDYTGGLLGGNANYLRPSLDLEFYRPHTRRRNVIAFRLQSSYITGFSNSTVPFYERLFAGGDYDIRGFNFRKLSPVSFVTRYVDSMNADTGQLEKKAIDDLVYVGGDMQAIANLEYRIPLVGPITLAPFLDAGNTWATRKSQLLREIDNGDGTLAREPARFLGGTNSGIRISAGVELQVIVPILQAPIRFIWAANPMALNQTYLGPVTGTPFPVSQPRHAFKFSMGRTF